ncbi:MAG: thiol peroxidase [Candidatus Omnitrophica bacterium]|nr:thiol peroxidase [Candidatus Omnitrophota bacterium]
MNRKISFRSEPLTLVGRTLRKGLRAYDFEVTGVDLKKVRLSDFSGKVKIVTTFPSLDTPVCDLQVKEFNKKVFQLSDETVILGISKDLPFAQKRFCDANNIKNVKTLSDYASSSFGINYGLLIKELNLLARAVLIIDKNDIIRYVQIVPELTQAPDYKDAINNLEQVLKDPEFSLEDEFPSKCKPCEEGTLPLPKTRVEQLLAQHRGWQLIEDKKLRKEFKFKDFLEAKYFVDLVSFVSQEQGHHPSITIIYNKVIVSLTTHASGGLTDNDFIMARAVDELNS